MKKPRLYNLQILQTDIWGEIRKKKEKTKDTRTTSWNAKIVDLKKTTLQVYFKTFIEKINSGNLIM